MLKRPCPASSACLPHAAMNLGAAHALGTRPAAGIVARLVMQKHLGAWCLFRLDKDGGYVGDSWHPSTEDALHQARREFGRDNLLIEDQHA